MGKNTTKKFVDKKNATSFVLSHSTGASENESVAEQLDKKKKLDVQLNEHTSRPGPVVEVTEDETEELDAEAESSSEVYPSSREADCLNLGLPDDGYDYTKHLRDPGGGGVFIAKVSEHGEGADVLAEDRYEGMEVFDDDMKRALGLLEDDGPTDDEAEMAEMEDDFIEQLRTLDANDYDDAEEDNCADEDRFADADEDDDYDPERDYSKWTHQPRQETLLDAQLDRLLDEYDDDEIGELEFDERTKGPVLLETAEQFEPEIKQFFESVPVTGSEPLGPGKDVHLELLVDRREQDTAEDIEAQKQAKALIKVKSARNLDGEEIVQDEVEVVKEEIEQWDCETILTTYSNLENHPRLVGPVQRIRLDPKSGLPIGTVLPFAKEAIVEDTEEAEQDEEDEEYQERANMGIKRDKAETPEEKRARKAAVKAEKAAARQRKKESLTEFKGIPCKTHEIGQVPNGVRVVPV